MTGPLKIAGLLFGSLKTTGGYQVFAYNLFKHLTAKKHDVVLYITANEYNTDSEFYSQLPFTVQPLLPKTKGLARYFPRIVQTYLRRRQKKAQHDIWQIIGAYPAGYLATTLIGQVPVVLRTHGDDVQIDETLNYGQRLDEQLNQRVSQTLHQMDRLIALTPSVSACYHEMGIDDKHIVEIPNGIDLQRFQNKGDKEALRRALNVPTDLPLLLTVSRNHPKKGLDTIPRIAAILKQQNISFHWLIVGKDVPLLQPDLEAQGVTDCVTTIGEIGVGDSKNENPMVEMPPDGLIDVYKSADIFVFPSRLETFGRVLIEAMATGLTIITTDAPGCRDVVQNRVTGLQCPPDRPEEMAKNIQTVLSDLNLNQQLKDNGYQHASKYDWGTIVESYEQLYYSLHPT